MLPQSYSTSLPTPRGISYFFKSYSTARSQTFPCDFDTLQESGVILQSVVKPIVLGLKSYEYSRGLSVPSYHHLFRLREAEVLREVVLHG